MAQQTARSDAQALMPEEVFDEFSERLVTQSAIMQLGRRAPDMNRLQNRVPVLKTLPISYFKNAGQAHSDTERKKTSKAEWEDKYLVAEDLVSIIPIPDNVADDVDRNIWDSILPYVEESMSSKFDSAVLTGDNAPGDWPDDLLSQAAAANAAVGLGRDGTDLYDNILSEGGLYNLIEERGYEPTGNVGAIKLRSKLRGLRDTNNQPIFNRAQPDGQNVQQGTNYEIDGVRSIFPRNGSVNANQLLMIAGQWDQLVWALRKDVTVDIFRTGVIQDTDGNITYNLLQDDMSAMRVVMRIAWQVPNPVNIQETDADVRFPFAALVPEGGYYYS